MVNQQRSRIGIGMDSREIRRSRSIAHRYKKKTDAKTLLLLCLFFISQVDETFSVVASVRFSEGEGLSTDGSSLFGNDIIQRETSITTGARRSWIEPNILLPAANLEKFFLYVAPNRTVIPQGQTEASLRLQIWRPVNRPQSRSFVLVFEEIVTVDITFLRGALYEFTFATPLFKTEVNDRIGWTNPNSFSIISAGFDDIRRTYHQIIEDNNFPLINGTALNFNDVEFPLTYSISVQLNADIDCLALFNSGQCMNVPGSFPCNCTDTGLEGSFGETDIDECQMPSRCLHGGKCVNIKPAGFWCDCTNTGYTGERCEHDINECDVANFCNSGQCINMPGSFSCKCADTGSERSFGETDIDECLKPSRCLHGGKCVNIRPAGFSCDCSNTGYTGERCEHDINECDAANFCNSGQCINNPGSFSCKCADTGSERSLSEADSVRQNQDLNFTGVVAGLGGLCGVLLIVVIVMGVINCKQRAKIRSLEHTGTYMKPTGVQSGNRDPHDYASLQIPTYIDIISGPTNTEIEHTEPVAAEYEGLAHN